MQRRGGRLEAPAKRVGAEAALGSAVAGLQQRLRGGSPSSSRSSLTSQTGYDSRTDQRARVVAGAELPQLLAPSAATRRSTALTNPPARRSLAETRATASSTAA